MFARLCLILTFLFAGDSTLPNGIRVYELPASSNDGNSFEVIAGYRTGVRNETAGTAGLADVVAAFLKSSPPARAMAVAAYGVGGEIEFFSDLDRTGIRLKMPNWARPMVEDSISEFLSETPQKNPGLADRSLNEVRSRTPTVPDVPFRINEQFRIALLGPGAKVDLTTITREAVGAFFNGNYGTDRAFVLMNGVPAKSLQNVERRNSTPRSSENGNNIGNSGSLQSSTTLRIQSDLDEGAVLLGAAVPSVYYRNWYAFLMLDRLIQQAIPENLKTELLPSLDPYFYRMEITVPSGLSADAAESALHQQLDQLQYVRASTEQLEVARRSAIQYLESEPIQRWFLSMGVPERRIEGLDWLKSFTADDIRATARDLIESKPVIAIWSPRVKTLRLDVEKLSDIDARAANVPRANTSNLTLGPVPVIPFPPHTDLTFKEQAPVRLDSGVSVVASAAYAVFVAPDSLQYFDNEPGPGPMQTSFGTFRADRILVMAPPDALDRVKQQWARFQGNPRDQTLVSIKGNITSADIPALLVLKIILDRRLIEAGLWNDIQLEIRASQGSTLFIRGSEANRHIVMDWIRDIASHPISDADLEWAREAAIHHLPGIRPELQSLIWEWNPDGTIFDIRLIPASQIQDVARIYLQ